MGAGTLSRGLDSGRESGIKTDCDTTNPGGLSGPRLRGQPPCADQVTPPPPPPRQGLLWFSSISWLRLFLKWVGGRELDFFSFLLSRTRYFLNVSLERNYCFYIEEKPKSMIWEPPPLVRKRKSLGSVSPMMLRRAWVRRFRLRVGA